MSNKLPAIVFLILLFLLINTSPSHAFWWMGYHKPEFKGKVIDAETKEPIAEAVVVAIYSKKSIGIAESYSVTINVREALTDKNGEFYIPSYTTIIQPLSWEDSASFIIFKPGYGNFQDYRTYPPKGIPLDVLEEFFAGDVGKEGELSEVGKAGGLKGKLLNKWKVLLGIVELPKLKTREERLRRMLGIPSGFGAKELPLLYKAIDEEKKIFDKLDIKE